MLWDTIWRPIVSLPFLMRETASQQDALRLLLAVRGLSRAHRELEWSLWAELQGPFLRHVEFQCAARYLRCELAQRQLFVEIDTFLRVRCRRQACIAGGFAAWRLDRSLQTDSGGDGYPRAIRSSTIFDGYARRDVWVPSNVDLFVEAGEDDIFVADAIGVRFVIFCTSLFRNARMITYDSFVDHDEDDLRRRIDETDVASMLDEFEFGQDVRRLCRDQMDLDRLVTPEAHHNFSSMRTYSFHATTRDPFFPTTLNVIFCTPNRQSPSPEASYVERVLTSFDLTHRRIACRVSPESGAYLFRARDASVHALAHRRLEIADGVFHRSREDVRRTLERLRRYIERGFSVRGEEFTGRLFNSALEKCSACEEP